MTWLQREIQLPALPPGCHDVTRRVIEALPELATVRVGLVNVFVQHTSASLTINENADPDVPGDLERVFDVLAPEQFSYRHTMEGPDDMPAHVKCALTDSSLTVPVGAGRLLLGTWQGIYLFEHRTRPHRRRVVAHLLGE